MMDQLPKPELVEAVAYTAIGIIYIMMLWGIIQDFG